MGLPQVSHTTPTVFYLYYGDVTCGGAPTPQAVWDGSYTGVYHLREAGSSNRFDSTVSAHHGVPGNFDNDEAAGGYFDGGDFYDGSDDHLLIPAATMAGLTDFTVCLWIKTLETGHNSTNWKNPTLFGQITTGYDSGDFGILSDQGYVGIRSGLCSSSDELHISTAFISNDVWHRVCAESDSTGITLYWGPVVTVQSI